MSQASMAESDASSPKLDTAQVERKLIKEGSVTFETNNPGKTRQHIIKSVDKYQGYISADETHKSSDIINYTLTIRVPAEHFDQLLADATIGVESLDSKSIQVKDVTEQFLDVQVWLKTKKALEKRYLELLEQAKAVTEILEVEKQLGQLRSDIESIEGRLNYLQNQVSFSTLRITFYQKDAKQSHSVCQLKEGFYNGWDNLIGFLSF
jgi:Rad3-related DNA helicase